jgi:hypothetical protein
MVERVVRRGKELVLEDKGEWVSGFDKVSMNSIV